MSAATSASSPLANALHALHNLAQVLPFSPANTAAATHYQQVRDRESAFGVELTRGIEGDSGGKRKRARGEVEVEPPWAILSSVITRRRVQEDNEGHEIILGGEDEGQNEENVEWIISMGRQFDHAERWWELNVSVSDIKTAFVKAKAVTSHAETIDRIRLAWLEGKLTIETDKYHANHLAFSIHASTTLIFPFSVPPAFSNAPSTSLLPLLHRSIPALHTYTAAAALAAAQKTTIAQLTRERDRALSELARLKKQLSKSNASTPPKASTWKTAAERATELESARVEAEVARVKRQVEEERRKRKVEAGEEPDTEEENDEVLIQRKQVKHDEDETDEEVNKMQRAMPAAAKPIGRRPQGRLAPAVLRKFKPIVRRAAADDDDPFL